jgi:hypothetical protein
MASRGKSSVKWMIEPSRNPNLTSLRVASGKLVLEDHNTQSTKLPINFTKADIEVSSTRPKDQVADGLQG